MAKYKSALTPEQSNPQEAIIPERVAKLQELFKKNNIVYELDQADKAEQLFEFRRQMRPNTYQYNVYAVYRVRDQSDRKKEYYFYAKEGYCLNQNGGTERSGTHIYGYAIEPEHETQYNDRLQRMEPKRKQDNPTYFLKWDKKEVQKLLEGSRDPCLNLYIGDAERKGQASQGGIIKAKRIKNMNDYLNGNFDDLLIIDKSGIGDEATESLQNVEEARKRIHQITMEKLTQNLQRT